MCVATRNREEFTKAPSVPILSVQRRSNFKVIGVYATKMLVVSACYNKQHVCDRNMNRLWAFEMKCLQ